MSEQRNPREWRTQFEWQSEAERLQTRGKELERILQKVKDSLDTFSPSGTDCLFCGCCRSTYGGGKSHDPDCPTPDVFESLARSKAIGDGK